MNNDYMVEQTQRQTPINPAAPPIIQDSLEYTPESDGHRFGWHAL